MRRLINQKRRKLNRWRNTKRPEDYEGVKDINKALPQRMRFYNY